ncbi:hypothetical protein LXL04_039901 [Taraxacum kok-saghyz]
MTWAATTTKHHLLIYDWWCLDGDSRQPRVFPHPLAIFSDLNGDSKICTFSFRHPAPASSRFNLQSQEIKGRFRELLKKYGKVALGVHFSVSAASISGLYVAIKNNVDIEAVLEKVRFKQLESILEKVGMGGPKEETEGEIVTVSQLNQEIKPKNRTAELAVVHWR